MHLGYFYYREHHPRPLDPYIKEKVYFTSAILLILFWTYDLRSTNLLRLGGIVLLGLICLFYFCKYIEGAKIKPGLDLAEYNRSSEFFSAYIKNIWYFIPKSLVLVSSICIYLIYVEVIPSVQIFVLLAAMGLYAPITFVFLYRRSVSNYIPPDSNEISDHVLNFYRYSELYPTDKELPIIEEYRQKIKSIGGDNAVKLIRLIQEKNLEDPLNEWEQSYKSLSGDLFYYYFIVTYATPLVWLIVDTLPLLYTIVPGYDLGLYGLWVVLAGSVFLAAEPLSRIPGTGKVQDARLVAYTLCGVLLLATGTLFQISSQLSNADVMTSFERSNFLLYLSPEMLSLILAFASTAVPFIVIPFVVVMAFRSMKDETTTIDEQNRQQTTLDLTYWDRRAEQEGKTVYVGPVGTFNERISVLVVADKKAVRKFAVNLEYYYEGVWHLIARFEHGINDSNSVDVLSDGLQMFVYQDESATAVIDDFPQVELTDAHLYCESFLIQHAEHLLSKYGKEAQQTPKTDNKTPQNGASLRLPYKDGEWTTINSTAHDLRERQTKIVAWGTDETIESIVQRVNQYNIPDI